MHSFYSKRRLKRYACFLMIVMLINIFSPTVSWALTSGPSQPEVQSFEPASTTQMVDLFTGDFTYNIPLFELPGPNGGYPFNLAYHAGIGMDAEASWCGLGWNLNPGSISRQMRGLPDEFKGDEITTKMSMKPSRTIGTGAGVGAEIFGGLGIGADMSLFYNSYKGTGLEVGVTLSYSKSVGGDATAGLGLGLSANSQEGVGVNPSLSLTRKLKEKSGEDGDFTKSGSIFVGAGYNSRTGLTGISTGVSVSRDKIVTKGKSKKKESLGSLGYSSTLSLANPGFIPSVGMPMINSSINMSFELGASWWGIYPNLRFSGFYNEQKLEHDKKNVKTPSYGYLHYQDAEENDALLDFNREKDGLVRDENPNLPIPSLTYDIYSATGQGYSAMYRPMRADVGTIHDPYESSVSKGLSMGGDVGPAIAHIGVNGTVNHAVSQSGKWDENNELSNLYNFREKEANSTYEPVYFKAHGEPTITPVQDTEDIGGEEAVRLTIGGNKSNPTVKKTLVKDKHKGWSKTAKDNSSYNAERIPRNSVITPVTNEILSGANGETIDLLKVDYLTSSGSTTKYNRTVYPGHHNAGFIALTPEGNRYVYGLPAYNTHQEEVSFSSPVVSSNTKVNVNPQNTNGEPNYNISGTNEYLDKKVIPPYAHSYLLTAIVGQDYVDVKGDGVTEDDLGYWVKFTYQQKASKSSPYKWRAPFYKANYFSGFKTTKEDDRGSYMYGEKEIWYLSRVETKSHIADFKISDRPDGRGAKYKLQNSNGLGATLSQLDEIVLYTRHAESVPLKRVKFEYTNDLCKNVENAASGVGKLTLKKLHFEYGTSERGRLNPYIFDYHEDNPAENPDYDMEDYDRWGNFRPNDPGDLLKNQEYPYVDQGESKLVHDVRAGVWSLKEITLPSGGHMIIDYEADDYAYVQNRTAMQMLELVEPVNRTSGNFNLTDGDLRMCFKLPVPIEVMAGVDSLEAAKPFFESDRDMLYFKLKMNLRSPSENQFDFITTYANLDKSKPPCLSKGASGDYEYGYFTLKSEKSYHPLSLRAWQHLKVNQPDLASAAGKVNVDDNESGLVSTLKGLAAIIPQVRQMFTGFYDYARNRDWGRELEAGKCWVRLQVPNKIKYGGGHRVKQITFKDNWKENNEGIYGQVYQYTTTDENGEVISSGVAANEPLIGGDENPIRYAKRYTESIPLISNNTLFFEYPVNEGYFPGPQVGYSKITVMSLASAAAAGEEVLHAERATGKSLFPAKEDGNFGTTGKTENEFYTAREFPVITDETLKEDVQNKTWIPIFPLGTISGKQLASSQGYSIITNDMHGKPKKVSHYAQSTSGEFAEEPFSWVQYNYMESGSLVRSNKVSKGLNNVFVDNNDGTLSKATSQDLQNSQAQLYHMGQETEFFADMRLHVDKSYFGGAAGNIDIVIIPIAFITVPIPVPSIWPSAGKDEKLLKTAVTNKVIFKSGILESVEAFNDGSHIVTRNVKWDKLTGRPVLTVVNNNFDKPLYNFEVPAHLVYEGVGPAYENTGFTFDINSLSAIEGLDDYYLVDLNYKTRNTLFEGDEIVLIGPDSIPKGKGVYIGKVGSSYQVFSKDNLADTTYSGFVYRSGKRNILSANAGNISALKDPTQSSGSKTYSIEILSEE